MSAATAKDNEQWLDLRGHLERVIDNEARLFSDVELSHLDKIVAMSDKAQAAGLAADFLQHSPLDGELLDIYAARLEVIIGHPIPVKSKVRTPIEERSAWVTNPEAKTFEIGW